MTIEFKTASRQHLKPLIGLYSESGCGKTMSALLLARGIVGPSGLIAMVDSESGRGAIYADVIPGSYKHGLIEPPFSPARYIEAVDATEQLGAAIGIIDSASHEWEGIGGVVESAGDNESRTGKAGLHNWKQPKLDHQKFVQRLLRSSIPWIVCLRAKYKSRQTKDEKGKTVIVKDQATSPIQAEDFIFEMTAHAEILPKHNIILTKCSHPGLRTCFPENETEPLSIKHGELIAKWCANPGTTQVKGATDLHRQRMIANLEESNLGEQAFAYAIDKAIILPNAGLDTWPLDKVPTTKAAMDELKKAISEHQ